MDTDGEKIIRLLDSIGKIMTTGGLRLKELEFIKVILERMLKATDNILEKINKKGKANGIQKKHIRSLH